MLEFEIIVNYVTYCRHQKAIKVLFPIIFWSNSNNFCCMLFNMKLSRLKVKAICQSKQISALPQFFRHFFSVTRCFDLEHNLFKNVFKGPAFLWQTEIQRLNMASMIWFGWKRKKMYKWLTHAYPLIWILKQFWCPKWI